MIYVKNELEIRVQQPQRGLINIFYIKLNLSTLII